MSCLLINANILLYISRSRITMVTQIQVYNYLHTYILLLFLHKGVTLASLCSRETMP